jgi:RNA polymerase sigma factor (sigma-70 family)
LQTELSSPTPSDLSILESVISTLTRSRRMRREDAEDFRQTVHLRLAERRDDVFRRFDGRSSLRTYLFVVVHRMLLDWRNHALGRWRPSAAARRLGAVAVNLEQLTHRYGYSHDEAITQLCSANRTLNPADIQRVAAALPVRPMRHVSVNGFPELTQAVDFEDPFEEHHRKTQTDRQRIALARALAGLPREDRRLVWLRYRRRLTVRAMAARLDTDPRRLYRRLEQILLTLRRRLLVAGVARLRAKRFGEVSP